MTDASTRVWVGVVTSHDVVAAGLRTILETKLGAQVFTTSGPVDAEPDIILYDVIRLHEGDGSDLDHWLKETASTVIAVTNVLRPDLGALAVERGVAAAIPLSVSAEDLVGVVRAAMTGTLDESPLVQEAENATRPGAAAGLSQREAQVLGLIVRGVSNREIADRCYLSINSIKTYIRSTYLKIGVANRAQAVAWGMTHGFSIDAGGNQGPPRDPPPGQARP